MDQIDRTTSDLGNALRQARKARGLTQAELASRAGIWQGKISNGTIGGPPRAPCRWTRSDMSAVIAGYVNRLPDSDAIHRCAAERMGADGFDAPTWS